MPGISEGELAEYLDGLTRATKDGLIVWKPVNPSTYAWDSVNPPPAKLLLQQVPSLPPRSPQSAGVQFTLHVLELGNFGMRTRQVIEGKSSNILNQKMQELFVFIRDQLLQQDLDFLKGTLPKRKE